MSVQINFDAKTVDPAQSLEALPAGKYICALTDSVQQENSKKNGHHMKLTFTVQDGEYKGRKVIETLNMWHTNETAAEIAWREFSALCYATNVLQIQDTAQLHGQPFLLELAVEQSEQYGPSNRVKGYHALIDGEQPAPPAPTPPAAAPPAPPAAPPATAAPTPPQAPASEGTPPWAGSGNGEAPAQSAPDSTPPWARGGS